MDRTRQVLEAAGAVGQGAGGGLEQAVRGDQTAAYEPAHVSVCQRALLDRYGGGRAGGGGQWRRGRGSSSLAAQQHLRSERATLSLDVYGGGVLPCRSSGGGERACSSKGPAWGGVSGDGAGGDRAGSAGAAGIDWVAAAEHGPGVADRGACGQENQPHVVGKLRRPD